MKGLDQTRRWHKGPRVLSVDSTLDRVTVKLNIILGDRQRLPTSNQQLLLDDIDTRDHFGHRVFHLYSSVHFNEEKLLVFIQKLKGTSTSVAHIDTGFDASLTDFGTQLGRNTRRWCLFKNLLVTTL